MQEALYIKNNINNWSYFLTFFQKQSWHIFFCNTLIAISEIDNWWKDALDLFFSLIERAKNSIYVEPLLLLSYAAIPHNGSFLNPIFIATAPRREQCSAFETRSFSLYGKEPQFLRIPNWLVLSIVIYVSDVRRRK